MEFFIKNPIKPYQISLKFLRQPR